VSLTVATARAPTAAPQATGFKVGACQATFIVIFHSFHILTLAGVIW